LRDESRNALHHPLACPFAANVDIAVIRISNETNRTALQLPVEFIEHEIAEHWRKRSSLRSSLYTWARIAVVLLLSQLSPCVSAQIWKHSSAVLSYVRTAHRADCREHSGAASTGIREADSAICDQVQQLADAVKNTMHGGPAALSNISGDLAQLAAVVQGGQALAYSLGGQDVAFRTTFPGCQPVFGPVPAIGTYQGRYAQWAQTSLATTQGLLRGVGLQGRLLTTEQGVLSVLRTLGSSNLLNRNDAINLTSQLAAEQIAQFQKLRELQPEDMTSKARTKAT